MWADTNSTQTILVRVKGWSYSFTPVLILLNFNSVQVNQSRQGVPTALESSMHGRVCSGRSRNFWFTKFGFFLTWFTWSACNLLSECTKSTSASAVPCHSISSGFAVSHFSLNTSQCGRHSVSSWKLLKNMTVRKLNVQQLLHVKRDKKMEVGLEKDKLGTHFHYEYFHIHWCSWYVVCNWVLQYGSSSSSVDENHLLLLRSRKDTNCSKSWRMCGTTFRNK